MTIDYQATLYNPIYRAVSVPATLLSTSGAEIAISVVDKTNGIAVTDRMQVETIRPVCRARTAELLSFGIDILNDLPNAEITFNGQTWRIKAVRDMPAPDGEATGETMLILLSPAEG